MVEGVPPSDAWTTPSASRSGLIGRSRECEAIQDVLDHTRKGTGAFLGLEGEAGIGKTALLTWGTGAATGFRILHARPGPDIDGHAYSAVSELLLPLRTRDGDLQAADGIVLDQLFALRRGEEASAADTAIDPLTVGAALLAYFEELSQRQPLLVVIDDAHWLDVSSALALAFVARRVEALAVAMLVAIRGARASYWRDSSLRTLTVSGLSVDAAAQLLEGRAAPDRRAATCP